MLSGGNELNLAAGFKQDAGVIYINYRGAEKPISRYRFVMARQKPCLILHRVELSQQNKIGGTPCQTQK